MMIGAVLALLLSLGCSQRLTKQELGGGLNARVGNHG